MKLANIPIYQISTEVAPTSNQHKTSIELLGPIHPPIVAPNGTGMFIIQDGRGRIMELMELGHQEVTCLVLDNEQTAEQTAKITLASNLGRRDNPMGEAEAIQTLLKTTNPKTGKSYTQSEIAELAGCSQPLVSKLMKLLKLIPEIQQWVKTGKDNGGIAPNAAFIAAGLDQEVQRELAANGPFTITDAQEIKSREESFELDLGNLPDPGEEWGKPKFYLDIGDPEALLAGEPITVEINGEKITIGRIDG